MSSAKPATRHNSFCRVCINNCPIVVDVVDGQVASVGGDRAHPAYEGYTCIKGRAQGDLLRHPGRLLHSLKRTGDGTFVPIPSDDALDEIAQRLRDVVDRHGPSAVAGYLGTNVIANIAASPFGNAFLTALGTPMIFTPNTIDKPGKPIARALHGQWMAPGQGFDDPRVALLIGANPLVSYTGAPTGNPGKWLAAAKARGMKVIVVDPRRNDAARRADLFLQTRPGHDAELMAAILRVVITEERYDEAFVAEHTRGLAALREAVLPFTPELVAERADVAAEDIVEAARIFADAGRGYAFAGTGPNMSGPGVLVEYLVLDLLSLCGYWQREGERVRNDVCLMPAAERRAQASDPVAARSGTALRVRNLTGTPAGMPTAALADEMLLEGEGQIRAMICCAGNPAVAWPDQAKVATALRELDLLVQIDPWMSQTARFADYVLAPTLPLEVASVTQMTDFLCHHGVGFGPVDAMSQYTPAIVPRPPGSDLLEEWQIFYRLARRLGLQLTLGAQIYVEIPPVDVDMSREPTTDEVIELLCRDSRISLSQVKEHPGGALFPEPATRVLPRDDGWEGRLDLANEEMLRELEGYASPPRHSVEHVSSDLPFALICRRMMHVYNSSSNHAGTHRGRAYNPAFLHPDDLEHLGVAEGTLVSIESDRASVLAVAESDPNLRHGLVSMTHCYGGLPDDPDDVLTVGTSASRLLRDDLDYDRLSGQPRMSNVPVRVRALAPEI
jgi:anaerobic selenocysteine-containing dehydrogenase